MTTSRDVLHELQLLRDLATANARTQAELGPLPPGGVPVEPKRKPKPWHPAVPVNQQSEEETMKLSHAAAVVALGVTGTLAACGAGGAPQESNVASPQQGAQPLSTSAMAAPVSMDGANAGCAEVKTLFHCTTTNSKEIKLCDLGETLEYSFGEADKTPELALSVSREEATTFQWQGIGRWISYSITIPSGDTEYTVFTSADRISDEHEFEAGVIATVGGAEVARVLCREPITHNIEGVDLKQQN